MRALSQLISGLFHVLGGASRNVSTVIYVKMATKNKESSLKWNVKFKLKV